MAKYELAQTGNLRLRIKAKNDEEYWEKVNSWKDFVRKKLAEIGIEFSWNISSEDYCNPKGQIFDIYREEWISFEENYKREYGGK